MFPKAMKKLPGERQFPAASSLEYKCNRSPTDFMATRNYSECEYCREGKLSSSKIVLKMEIDVDFSLWITKS